MRPGRGAVAGEALEVHDGGGGAGRPERPPVEDGGQEGGEGLLLVLEGVEVDITRYTYI